MVRVGTEVDMAEYRVMSALALSSNIRRALDIGRSSVVFLSLEWRKEGNIVQGRR